QAIEGLQGVRGRSGHGSDRGPNCLVVVNRQARLPRSPHDRGVAQCVEDRVKRALRLLQISADFRGVEVFFAVVQGLARLRAGRFRPGSAPGLRYTAAIKLSSTKRTSTQQRSRDEATQASMKAMVWT